MQPEDLPARWEPFSQLCLGKMPSLSFNPLPVGNPNHVILLIFVNNYVETESDCY